MGNFIRSVTTIPLPSGNIPVIDYEVHTSCLYLDNNMLCRTILAYMYIILWFEGCILQNTTIPVLCLNVIAVKLAIS